MPQCQSGSLYLLHLAAWCCKRISRQIRHEKILPKFFSSRPAALNWASSRLLIRAGMSESSYSFQASISKSSCYTAAAISRLQAIRLQCATKEVLVSACQLHMFGILVLIKQSWLWLTSFSLHELNISFLHTISIALSSKMTCWLLKFILAFLCLWRAVHCINCCWSFVQCLQVGNLVWQEGWCVLYQDFGP